MEAHVLDYSAQNPALDQIKFVGFVTFLVWIGKFIFRWTLLLAAKGIIEFVNLFVPFFKLFRKELKALAQVCVAAIFVGGLAFLILFGVFFC